MSRDKESLIEKAAEITAMQEAYSYLTTRFEFGDEMLDDVLALENPLKYFADRWLLPVSDVFDVDMDIRENIAESEIAGIPVSERTGCFCPGTAAKCGSGSAGMSGFGETGTRIRCTVMGRKLYYDGRCIDAYVPVPKDLTKVKTKLAFNLTKRQLICFSLAGLVGLPVYFFTRGAIGNSAAVLLMIG